MAVSDELARAPPAANSGAGGKGLLGLPPYFEEGVPGRGLPLISAGSYDTDDGRGRVQSTEPLVGVSGLAGELRSGEMFRG